MSVGDRCYHRVELAGNVAGHRVIASPGSGDFGPGFIVWGEAGQGSATESGFFRLEHEKAPELVLDLLMAGGLPLATSDVLAARFLPGDPGRVHHVVSLYPSGCGTTFRLLFHAKELLAHGEIGPILPSFFLPKCEELGYQRVHLVPADIDGEGVDEFVALSISPVAGEVYFNDNAPLGSPVRTTALRESGGFELSSGCEIVARARAWRSEGDSTESLLVLANGCDGASSSSLLSFRLGPDGTVSELNELALELPGPFDAMTVADIDLDGSDDVLVAGNGHLVSVTGASGGFGQVSTLEAVPVARAPFGGDEKVTVLATGNFFGGAEPEVVVREAAHLAIVSVAGEPTVHLDVEAEHFAALDINGDGAADLAVSTSDGLVLWTSE